MARRKGNRMKKANEVKGASNMYGLYKRDIEYPMYLKRCCGFESRNDATAEAEWREENGEGWFVVIKEE